MHVQTHVQHREVKMVVSLLFAFAVCWNTYAAAMLQVSDGITTATISDNTPGDANPLAGAVTYSADVNGWRLYLASGVTKPIIGSSTSPSLDLTWQAWRMSAEGGSNLTIRFSENGFVLLSPSSFVTDSGGTLGPAGNNATITTFCDFNNIPLATTTLLTSNRPTSPPNGFSGSTAGGPIGADPSVAFTIELVLSQAVGSVSSGDIDLHRIAHTFITAITRASPISNNLSSVQWAANFLTNVSGLRPENFGLVSSNLISPRIVSVTPVGSAPTSNWIITASSGSGVGTLGLNMVNSTFVSSHIPNLPFTGEVYSVNRPLGGPVTSLQSAQRAGNTSCDIFYDLGGTNLFEVTLEVSTNGGAIYFPLANNLTGDFGPNVPSGQQRHIVWNFGSMFPGRHISAQLQS